MIQVAVTPQQHGLIAMTKDLRGHANTDAISQQRCCHPVADVVYPQIGPRSMPVKLDHFFL